MNRSLVCAVLVSLLIFITPSSASIITFSGIDGNVAPGGPTPLSDAAFFSFAAASGPLSTIDFESATLGAFSSLSSVGLGVPGVSLSPAGGSDGDDTDIRNTDNQILGFNTTGGGSQFLHFIEQGPGEPAIGVNFDFVTPVFAWGGYFTGLESGVDGTVSVEFNDGTAQLFALAEPATAGVQFFGFTSTVAVSTVSVILNPNVAGSSVEEFGLDDVSYSTEATVPEPSTMLLTLAGIALIAIRRKRA